MTKPTNEQKAAAWKNFCEKFCSMGYDPTDDVAILESALFQPTPNAPVKQDDAEVKEAMLRVVRQIRMEEGPCVTLAKANVETLIRAATSQIKEK